MNITTLWVLIRHQWRWAAIGLAGGLLLAFVAVSFMPKQFTAHALVYFTAVGAEDAGSLAQGTIYVQNQIKTYPVLVTSPSVLRRASESMGGDPSPGALSASVTAHVPSDSTLMELTVQGDSPERAAEAAKAVALSLGQEVVRLETRADPRVVPVQATLVDDPALPASPSSPDRVAVLGSGGILGLLSGLGCAYYFERQRLIDS